MSWYTVTTLPHSWRGKCNLIITSIREYMYHQNINLGIFLGQFPIDIRILSLTKFVSPYSEPNSYDEGGTGADN